VLVLDEPTNDLDIDTLELLEDLLQNYDGTGVPGQPRPDLPGQRRHQHHCRRRHGQWREYEGGVQDWLVQSKRSSSTAEQAAAKAGAAKPAPAMSGHRQHLSPGRRSRRRQAQAQLQGTARELE
jgi:ATP-binding cassette subfamily F protein uup